MERDDELVAEHVYAISIILAEHVVALVTTSDGGAVNVVCPENRKLAVLRLLAHVDFHRYWQDAESDWHPQQSRGY